MAGAPCRSGKHQSIDGGSCGGARVRMVPEDRTVSAPLHLQLHLANGRRAELLLSDERQLARVLELLEQST
jgi:hypothetical protein